MDPNKTFLQETGSAYVQPTTLVILGGKGRVSLSADGHAVSSCTGAARLTHQASVILFLIPVSKDELREQRIWSQRVIILPRRVLGTPEITRWFVLFLKPL